MNNFNFDFDNTADEDFFGNLRSKSSKLQQLLEDDTLPEAEKQQSLKYQRPKTTDLTNKLKNETLPSTSSAPAVFTLMAKVATAYRHSQLQGKVGVALVKTAEDSLKLVIYKSKETVLATLQLLSDRQSLFKQQRYWQFYDDTTEVDWSFCFEAQEDDEEFHEALIKNGQVVPVAMGDKKDKGRNKEVVEEIKHIDTKELNDAASTSLTDIVSSSEIAKNRENAKTTLIKRMAKMGQPLPNLSATSMQTTTEFSDSSDSEVIKTPLAMTQKPSIAPRTSKIATFKTNQHQMIASSMAFNTSPVYSAISNNMESQYMQMLLTEHRTQGSELRMNVQKLETKIEKVLDKLDYMDRGDAKGEQKKHKDDEILELEEKILNLKKENRKLKQIIESTKQNETYETKSKEIIEELKDDLREMNIKQSNDVEKVVKACLQSLQYKKETMEQQQELINKLERNKKDMENDLDIKEENNKTLELSLQDLKEQDVQQKLQLDEKVNLLKELEQKIEELEKDVKDKSTERSETSTDAVIKSIMNNLFADICTKITPSVCSDAEKVLSLVGLSIKQQTLKALQQQKSGDEGQ